MGRAAAVLLVGATAVTVYALAFEPLWHAVGPALASVFLARLTWQEVRQYRPAVPPPPPVTFTVHRFDDPGQNLHFEAVRL